MIVATNPDVKFLRTSHDLGQVKSEVWRLNEKLAPNFSHTGNAIRTAVLDARRGTDVDAVVKALNEQDKAAYDTAFDKIAAHAAGNSHVTQAATGRIGRKR